MRLTAPVTFLLISLCFAHAQSSVRISEFMAENDSTLIDDDDDRSDWIELQNMTSSPVSLEGWHLTDDPLDPIRWTFPQISIAAGQRMVVFASGKDRAMAGAPMHTSFRLSTDGDYLALIEPDGTTVATEFAPAFPPQRGDVSYGFGDPETVESPLLPSNLTARALIPENGDLGLSWTEVGFDDAAWQSGPLGVGYDYNGLIGLDVRAMRYVNQSVFIRVPFDLAEVPDIDRLILRLLFEDGMVAYLNGHEIARENAPENVDWDTGAPNSRNDSIAVIPFDIDISSAIDLLQPGENVLAFHGLNYLLTSSDFLMFPELISVANVEGEVIEGYFPLPTPGKPNVNALTAVLDKPVFAVASGSFTESFALELSLPDGLADGMIRYTLDGSDPTATSTLYQSPVQISSTVRVRARTFGPNGAQSAIREETYMGVANSARSFSSNLPLVVIDSFGGGGIPDSVWEDGVMAIHEPSEDGRTTLTSEATLVTRIGFKRRGSSTAGRPKPSLSVEARDDEGRDRNVEVLGMPAESDWVLWGPYNFDRALMRNPLIYELSNQIGRYAVRTRFVEVFLNTGGGSTASSDYWGVYAIMEKISRDEDRVDVEKLFPEHDREPNITGGYMLKIDRPDPGDSGFSAAGKGLLYVTPKEVEMERPERDAQEAWIRAFITGFGAALNRGGVDDPDTGFGEYLDVGAAVDHHLLNVLAFNVDALRLSTYMYIPRGGKLTFGPIWDFDRAMGSTDGRDINPFVWRSQTSDRGTDFFNYTWWGQMFSDIDFFQKYIDRWWELRSDEFSVGNIHAIIDRMASELNEAQSRNLDRWGQGYRFGGYQGEVDHLKDWFADRISFMDGQFVDPPVFAIPGGRVEEGFQVTLTSPEGGEIYYTLNETDPRASGAGVSPGAIPYDGPITIDVTTVVTARVRNLSHTSLTGADNPPLSSRWSGVSTARFAVDRGPVPGDLIITEIQYHPAVPTDAELTVDATLSRDDFEFLEIRNVSDDPLDLRGTRFTDGIGFDFTGAFIDVLDAGERILLVRNEAAFGLRYGASDRVAGVYDGGLSDAGEPLVLVGEAGTVLLQFEYKDGWAPVTDGVGFSLVLADESTPSADLGEKENWRQSAVPHGSAGVIDPEPPMFPRVVINEALANSEEPEVDTVELYNDSGETADIGGWFLSDDRDEPFKFRFPDGTTIDAGGFLVVDETIFGEMPDGFSLSSLGESVQILSGDRSGVPTGYLHGYSFGASATSVPFGRHLDSEGGEHFVAQRAASFGEANAGPLVGPVVVNEIMYHPAMIDGTVNELPEFVELHNLTGADVDLFDQASPSNPWEISGGIDMTLSGPVSIPANGFLLLVDFDPSDGTALADFVGRYGVPDGVQILGPFDGKLSNGGETVRLSMPGAPVLGIEGEEPAVPMIVVDEIRYSEDAPWPVEASGTGLSIQRITAWSFGNEPLNWVALEPTPGAPNAGTLLVIDSISRDGGTVSLRFQAEAGKAYSVLGRTSLVDGDWEKLEDVGAEAESRIVEIDDTGVGLADARFYRIVTPAIP